MWVSRTVQSKVLRRLYDKYDFLKADSYNLDGDCMNQILPGGKYHDQFNAYLDMVAEYASQVDGKWEDWTDRRKLFKTYRSSR